MGLYGYIEHDGRVLRSIGSLTDDHDVSLFSHCKDEKFQISNARLLKRKNTYYAKNPYLEQILFFFAFLSKAIKLKPDVVYVHDYYLTFVGRIAKLVTGAKVVYDAHELTIVEKEEKVDFRTKLFFFLEKISIHSFDLIIAANDERARMMKEYYGLAVQPEVVRNIPDVKISHDLFSKDQLEENFQVLKNSSSSIYIYQGVVTPIRRIDLLVGEIAKIENAIVLIVGGGSESYIQELKNGFKEKGLENVHFLGKVDLKTLYSLLNISDFGLISYSDANLNNKYCAPNKLYEYSQFQLPMITTGQEIFHTTFKNFKIGLVRKGSDSEFLQELNEISNNENIKQEFEKFNKVYNQKEESLRLNQVISLLAK